MHNVGEEIAGEYLRTQRNCEFVEYNLYTPDVQGEIDVVGISLADHTVYLCEVAVHLTTGLRYVDQKTKQSCSARKLIQKLEKDLAYAQKYFSEYKHVLMLWSPIIKQSKAASKQNQTKDIQEIQSHFLEAHNIKLELITDQVYQECLVKLRAYAANESKELKSTILRYLQIEEHLAKHLKRIAVTDESEHN